MVPLLNNGSSWFFFSVGWISLELISSQRGQASQKFNRFNHQIWGWVWPSQCRLLSFKHVNVWDYHWELTTEVNNGGYYQLGLSSDLYRWVKNIKSCLKPLTSRVALLFHDGRPCLNWQRTRWGFFWNLLWKVFPWPWKQGEKWIDRFGFVWKYEYRPSSSQLKLHKIAIFCGHPLSSKHDHLNIGIAKQQAAETSQHAGII